MVSVTQLVYVWYFMVNVLCPIVCSDVDSGFSKLEEQKYELIKPRIISNENTGAYRKKLFVELKTENSTFLLILRRNSHLVSLHYHTNYWDGDKNLEKRNHSEDCYYHGRIAGRKRSSRIIISLCNGFNGIIYDSPYTYYITPAKNISEAHHGSNKIEEKLHLFYNLTNHPKQQTRLLACNATENELLNAYFQHLRKTDMMKENKNKFTNVRKKRLSYHFINSGTKVWRQNVQLWRKDPSLGRNYHLSLRKKNIDQYRHIELYLVNDHSVYDYYNRNISFIEQRSAFIANILDDRLKPLNIRVILAGVEVWSERDLIKMSDSSFKTLLRFMKYRYSNINGRVRNDNAHLITRRSFDHGETAGKAPMATMCSMESSAAINQDFERNPLYIANVIAHELGHNLGMTHDDKSCTCSDHPERKCIMGQSMDLDVRSYSSCSKRDLEANIDKYNWECLEDVPLSQSSSSPLCGNGIVNEGESCDCGSAEECQHLKNLCCNPITCQFYENSTCDSGECCQNCQFARKGKICHLQVNQCDLPEYCTGVDNNCPEDVFVHDGAECSKQNDGVCYSGACISADDQCKSIFGENATSAHTACYQQLNIKGNELGYCKQNDDGFTKCSAVDVQCGKLQCYVEPTTLLRTDVFTNIILQKSHSELSGPLYHLCTSLASNDKRSDLIRPGTSCGANMQCINNQCVKIKQIKCKNRCYDNGICNNKDQCHCFPGWLPPYCNESKSFDGLIHSRDIFEYSELAHGHPINHVNGNQNNPIVTMIIIGAVTCAMILIIVIAMSLRKACRFLSERQKMQQRLPTGALRKLLDN